MESKTETGNHPRPLRILAVEDSDFLRQVFRAAFRDQHIIETAEGVRSGWDKYLQLNPDLMFIDILLPDGSGHDLAYRIKQDKPSVYVVMATASDYPDDHEEAIANHADDFITKPFDKQKVDEIIERCRTVAKVRF